MTVYLGLTGPLGSGKGTVADILALMAKNKNIRVIYHSLSNEVRREVNYRSREQERGILKEVADHVRSKIGAAAWAMSVVYTIKNEISELSDDELGRLLVIVDGIRNPKEVYELQTQFGSRFFLQAVIAPPEIVQGNIKRRKRKDEGEEIVNNDAKILELHQSEMGAGEPVYGHNVSACVELANLPIINNDGSLSDLEKKAAILLNNYIIPNM